MSNHYLLDTNICVHFLRGEHQLQTKFAEIGLARCFVSEITIAELLFGVANSAPEWQPRQQQHLLEFRKLIAHHVLPITPVLEIYAEQKASLRRMGRPIDEFDLLIGSTALTHDLTLVTHNTKHFTNLTNIILEDWVAPTSSTAISPAGRIP